MDMPTICPNCEDWVDFSEMYFPAVHFGEDTFPSDYCICRACFQSIEEEMEA